MKEVEINLTIKVYEGFNELDDAGRNLIREAKAGATSAYTPYSKYNVGCALLLENGEIIKGSNQENASFPAGICAERVALSAASSLFPSIPIRKMAIVSGSTTDKNGKPVAPCGICRQTIFEYENRFENDISILLLGENEEVYEFKSIKDLLPLGFSGKDFLKIK